ncbi:MAG: TPM domain-containing protein [Paracoccus sp. (in: a-proteobacteria)]|uniref:TPM domain-containing protein n=1 Tax=Paracoccus sp. TaxID=267 RepID=UPI0039E3CB2F
MPRSWATLLLVLLALLPGAVLAQALPRWQATTLNDFAGVVTARDAEAIEAGLSALRRETGIEGTVVTLQDRARYGGIQGLDAFATRLFNDWGVGDARRQDGFMILVLPGDREARIELGRGYPNDADILAQDIMRGSLLPAFRAGDLSAGLREGTAQVIARIARPHASGMPGPAQDRDWAGRLLPLAGFALILGLIGRRIWRRGRCPKCGGRGLITRHEPRKEPLAEGGYRIADQSMTRHCPHCDWTETRLRPQPRIGYYGAAGELLRQERNPAHRSGAGGGGAGFGGGSSRGGGASGRW